MKAKYKVEAGRLPCFEWKIVLLVFTLSHLQQQLQLSLMACQEKSVNPRKRSLPSDDDDSDMSDSGESGDSEESNDRGNIAKFAIKRRKIVQEQKSSQMPDEELLYDVIFRKIKYPVHYKKSMSIPMFKKRILISASKFIIDFDPVAVDQEHFRLLIGGNPPRRTPLTERLLQTLTGDNLRKYRNLLKGKMAVYVEEAIGVIVTIPGSDLQHGLFVFHSDREGFKSQVFQLMEGNLMEDNHILFNIYREGTGQLIQSASELKNGDKVEVRIEDKAKTMEIYAKTLTGKTITIKVPAVDYNMQTVSWLKRTITSIEGIPSKQQKIVFAGLQLQDDRKLVEYTVKRKPSIICKNFENYMIHEIHALRSCLTSGL